MRDSDSELYAWPLPIPPAKEKVHPKLWSLLSSRSRGTAANREDALAQGLHSIPLMEVWELEKMFLVKMRTSGLISRSAKTIAVSGPDEAAFGGQRCEAFVEGCCAHAAARAQLGER